MTRYTADHLAEAQRLAPGMNSKALERVAQALADRELDGRMAMAAELATALRKTLAFKARDQTIRALVGWLEARAPKVTQ